MKLRQSPAYGGRVNKGDFAVNALGTRKQCMVATLTWIFEMGQLTRDGIAPTIDLQTAFD